MTLHNNDIKAPEGLDSLAQEIILQSSNAGRIKSIGEEHHGVTGRTLTNKAAEIYFARNNQIDKLVCPMYICPGLNRDEIKFNGIDEKTNFIDEVCKRGQYDCSCSYYRQHKGEEKLVGVTI